MIVGVLLFVDDGDAVRVVTASIDVRGETDGVALVDAVFVEETEGEIVLLMVVVLLDDALAETVFEEVVDAVKSVDADAVLRRRGGRAWAREAA